MSSSSGLEKGCSVERLRPIQTGMVPRPGARCSADPSGLLPDPDNREAVAMSRTMARGTARVVRYTRTHRDAVASDLIVRDSHSTQSTPATIVDVRRIFYLHPQE